MKIVILSIIAFSLFSCANTKKLTYNLDENKCYIPTEFKQNILPSGQPFYKLKIDTILSDNFSEKSLYIANTIGIYDLLEKYALAKKEYQLSKTIESRLNLLELSQSIMSKMNLASLEVSSFASELDCQEDIVSQIAEYMHGKEQQLRNSLTSIAIGVGAVSTITLGSLSIANKTNKTTEAIGIGIGVIEAALGVIMLTQTKKATITHQRNMLSAIWNNSDTSHIFPTFIWDYLNYYNPNSVNDTISKRVAIVNHWKEFNQITSAKPKIEHQLTQLYFGSGGKYTTGQLHNRSNMYNQLESFIKLMKQDLSLLTIEFERFK
jgi:hypothetical protein